MPAQLTTHVRALLEAPSPEAAVAVLRAADSSGEEERRLAIAELESHLRTRPERRERDIAAALVALRRAGPLS